MSSPSFLKIYLVEGSTPLPTTPPPPEREEGCTLQSLFELKHDGTLI